MTMFDRLLRARLFLLRSDTSIVSRIAVAADRAAYASLFMSLLIGTSLWADQPRADTSVSAQQASQHLNVVLIVVDDLGARDCSCYGSTFHRTPTIDQLAQSGMMFTNAYANCPVCSPSRYAIQTGKYQQRGAITDWLPGRADLPDQMLARASLKLAMDKSEITLAEVFKKWGYTTCHLGKWHLGGIGSMPTDHGYDINIAGDHTGTPISYFAPYVSKSAGKAKKKNSPLTMPGLESAPEGEYLTDRLGQEAAASSNGTSRINRQRSKQRPPSPSSCTWHTMVSILRCVRRVR